MGYARAWTGLATAVAGLSAVAVFGLAGPAAADVSIDSEQGQRTGGARIAFRVTNDSSTTSITKVEVLFPGGVNIPEIYPIAVSDWAPSITMTKVDNNRANDVPTSVVWVTMPGREIKPGATSVLPLAMGPMPDAEIVYFDVIQTRSDGSTETWAGVDVPASGAQHPAFALKLAPLEPGQVPENHGHEGAAATGQAQNGVADDPAAEEPIDADGSSPVRLVLVLLLIVALTAFALFWQRRRNAAGAADDRAEAGDDRAEAADDAAPVARVPAQRKKSTPPKKAAAAKEAAAEAEEVAEPAARVRRRAVVRATAAKTAAERRAAARKSTGGAATVTISRRRGSSSKRAGKTEGDNA